MSLPASPASRYIVSPSPQSPYSNVTSNAVSPTATSATSNTNRPNVVIKHKKVKSNGEVRPVISHSSHHSTVSEHDYNFNPLLSTTQRYCDLTHPRQRTDTGEYVLYDVWNTKLHEMNTYGIGIMSYFRLLKSLCWIMFLISLCCIPALIFNSSGSSLENSYDIEETTLGNFGTGLNSNITDIQWAFYNQFADITYTYTMDKRLAMLIEMCCDSGYCAIFLLGCLYMYTRIKTDAHTYNSAVNTIAKYTVEIRNLPTLYQIATRSKRQYNSINLRSELNNFLEPKYGVIGDISIQYNDISIIEMYKERAELKKSLLTAQVNNNASDIQSYTQKLAEQTSQIKYQQSQLLRTPVLAYVTFEYITSVKSILKHYPNSFLAWLFMPVKHRFYGNRLYVRHAPEPSNVNFANLAYSNNQRRFRRMVSTVLTLIVLILGIILISIITYYQNDIPEPPACTNAQYSTTDASMVDASNLEQVTCYCSKLSADQLVSAYDVCKSYIASYAVSKGLILVTSITTLIINEIQFYGVNRIVRYEKHLSNSGEQRNIAIKLFIGIFINTAIILLIVNANVAGLKSLVVIFNGTYTDFSSQWFKNVGLSIFLTHALTLVTPQSLPIISYLYAHCKRNYKTELCTTQDQLNQLYSGKQFNLSKRYSMILVIVYVALFYSGGIPLLLPLTALILIVTYWIDKYTFLRYYRIPPRYDESLSLLCIKVLPYCILAHLSMSCWYYSAPNTASYTIDLSAYNSFNVGAANNDQFHIKDRLQQVNVLPLFIFWAVLILFYLLKSVLQLVFFCRMNERTDNTVQEITVVTYSEAKQKYRFESYHLHLQDEYASAYMITTSKLQAQPELSLNHNELQPTSIPVSPQTSNKQQREPVKSVNLSLLHRQMRAQAPQQTVFTHSVLNHSEQSHINSDTYASNINIRAEESVYTQPVYSQTHQQQDLLELNVPASPAISINQTSPQYRRIRSIDTYQSNVSDVSMVHAEQSILETSKLYPTHTYRTSAGAFRGSYSNFNTNDLMHTNQHSVLDVHNAATKSILKKTNSTLLRMPSADPFRQISPTASVRHKRASTTFIKHHSNAAHNHVSKHQPTQSGAIYSSDVMTSQKSYTSDNTVELSNNSHSSGVNVVQEYVIPIDTNTAQVSADRPAPTTPSQNYRPHMDRQFSVTLTQHDSTVAQVIVSSAPMQEDRTIDVPSSDSTQSTDSVPLQIEVVPTTDNQDKKSATEINGSTVG